MGDDEAFLAAIAADPGGDAARLIYADWLDELGDGRADYLRLASEAAACIREGRPWDDLRPALNAPCHAEVAAWRESAGPWFDVVLEAFPPDEKRVMIYVVHAITGVGLRAARELIDSAPVPIVRRRTLEQAEAARLELVFGYRVAGLLPPSNEPPICRAALRESRPEG